MEENNKIEGMFKKYRVLTLEQISKKMDSSKRTVQRRLFSMSVYRSYNKNSRYYTIPGIPDFNSHGIWEFEGIYFSKKGTLRKTVIHLVNSAEKGLSAKEIGEILKLPPHSFMHHFRNDNNISRQKEGGSYIYYAKDAEISVRQKKEREDCQIDEKLVESKAIRVLVEFIKNPGIKPDKLCDLLKKKGLQVDAENVELFLEKYGLLKKTPDLKQ